MISLSLTGAITAAVLFVVGYVYWQIHKIKARAQQLARANAELTTQNQQLKTEKVIIEKQVKNYKVKQKNDETTNSLGRDAIIDELRQNGDLRAE
ncbi:DUF2681 domain-containing protein [Aggregatibacter actinomycetemcomitans]|uniref:DUF2681 domain-containing protein n=1 Tax=Aggregatibacter actinomycetemcomitans TaxID=714 RepID=UPI000D69946F|nr:DUF2681 domain-containing protein [Aggregatibacter actinomycetemcomitans]